MGKRFPLFIDLQGKAVVVVGSGTIGGKRAMKLADFGARVTCIDPKAQPIDGMTLVQRMYQEGDLQGAFLCIVATDDQAVNRQVAQEAKALGILVNVADDPSLCDFFFPALCETQDMVVGLVGDGTDHHKTATVAKQIRTLLNQEDSPWT